MYFRALHRTNRHVGGTLSLTTSLTMIVTSLGMYRDSLEPVQERSGSMY